jgi:hypothetical protein
MTKAQETSRFRDRALKRCKRISKARLLELRALRKKLYEYDTERKHELHMKLLVADRVSADVDSLAQMANAVLVAGLPEFIISGTEQLSLARAVGGPIFTAGSGDLAYQYGPLSIAVTCGPQHKDTEACSVLGVACRVTLVDIDATGNAVYSIQAAVPPCVPLLITRLTKRFHDASA